MLQPLVRYQLCRTLLKMADDELILGHRDSEWTGHAPILEEDIAFSNIAQDELGHALIWYNILSDLDQCDPDKMVFFRDAESYRNVLLVELPKGDWAFTIIRQYLCDVAEIIHLEALCESIYYPLADAARKIIKEEWYHRMHSSAWVTRLGDGTEESHRRMQEAVYTIWPYTGELFEVQEEEKMLVDEEIFPDREKLYPVWLEQTTTHFHQAGLAIPERVKTISGGREGKHTEHLMTLLEDMQMVARLDQEAQW